MAKELIEDKEKQYSVLERILLFTTPILFTIILLGGLLLLVNSDWRDSVLAWADEVPILNKIIPDQDKSKTAEKDDKKKEVKGPTEAEQITELKNLLASKDIDLRTLADKRKELEQQVSELNQQLKELKNKDEQTRISEEEYAKQVKDLANMYAKMMPSKAAPIMENLTIEEMVLVFNAMNSENRVKIMEKMNAKVAAEVSIRLKDITPSSNPEIAALQSRLNKQEAVSKSQTGLDSTQLSQTFSSMSSKSAAEIILETAKISNDKALAILNKVDDATRSKLLSAMTEIDKVTTAKLFSKIVPNK